MEPSESLNDILEEPISEWADDNLDEELDLKTNVDLSSHQPDTTVSQLPEDNKSLHSKDSQQSVSTFSTNKIIHDPIVESIIESRKPAMIENTYTRLAQTTSQSFRSTQNISHHSLKLHSLRGIKDNQVHFNDINYQNEKNFSLSSARQFENDPWDDGLHDDFDKESMASIDKSSIQVYEETCKRLNICPCSMIIRSLYTTKINLGNYGLGAKGSAALAVALLRNITVLSLNLSGNNIGNDGMSHIYQILTENTYVEEYDLSNNNLGTKGVRKLAAGAGSCAQLRVLNAAGNQLTGSDITILLSKLEDHRHLKDLNISRNQLDEEGGIYIAKWLTENTVLLHLDISWCSIRLLGARAIAKAIGDNGRLQSLDLSYNSFTNETLELLTNSLTRNLILKELNLSGNEIFCRYDTRIRGDPSILILGKEAVVYKLFVIAATNQALKIFRLGKNHLDARCVMVMLESLSKLDNISLEELDLTGLTLSSKQISDMHEFFSRHLKFTCYVGPVRQTVEHFANNLLNSIHHYCKKHQISLTTLFKSIAENNPSNLFITYNQFRDGLKKARIPFPVAQLENIIKYLGRDDDEGTISLRSLEIVSH